MTMKRKRAYKILTPTRLSFVRTFNSLVKLGFCYGGNRLRKVSSLNTHNYLVLGTNSECKMVMYGFRHYLTRGFKVETVSLKEFKETIFPNYSELLNA